MKSALISSSRRLTRVSNAKDQQEISKLEGNYKASKRKKRVRASMERLMNKNLALKKKEAYK